MPNIKYSDGKQWINVHTTFKATETTHGVAKVATSDEVLQGTNDESFVTPKKLKEVVETLPVEAEVVHKEGEEVITGLKTFSGNDDGVGNIIVNNPSLGISDEVDSTPQFGEIEFTDKDGSLVGSLDAIRGVDDGNGYNAIRLSSANGEGISAHTPLELRNYDDGTVVAVAPTPNTDAKGIEVITAEWIQPKLEAESRARTDEDTRLAGLITAEETARTNADSNLQQQITQEVTDRTNADNNLQQQITQEVTDRTNADNNLQQQITTNLNSINAINEDIVEINEVLATKQDQLTEKQLAAVNSGVTEATVTQVATNVSNILELQNKKADITYVDGQIDLVEKSITDNVNTLNTRIDTEVETLNGKIDLKSDKTYVDEELAKKADKSDTYTKAEVDAKVSSVYRYKGSVEKIDALPMEGNVEGDVYNVTETGENFAWVAPSGDVAGYWDDIGGDIDLTPYLTKEEASTTYETITNVNALSQSVDTRVAQLQANIDTKVAQSEYNAKVEEIEKSITDNVNTLNTRIDTEVETLNGKIDLKADKETTYTKTEVDALVEPKADKTYVDGEVDKLEQSITDNVNTINGRIDTEIETLNDRIDSEVSTLNDAIALKADITYVDGEVDKLEQSITDNVNTINGRIDTEVKDLQDSIATEVNTLNLRIDSEVKELEEAIDLKADKTYVNEELAKKADKETTYTKTEVDALVEPKADKTYVDEQDTAIGTRIDTEVSTLNTRIDTEVETLNGKIDLKADKETTYTKTEVDNLLSPKATTEYVDGQIDLVEKSITDNVNTINGRIDDEVEALEEAIDLKADKSSIGDATITFQKNGGEVGKFTTNQATNSEINFEIPTKVSELTNDSNYQTKDEVNAVATELRGLITSEETARTNADSNLQTQIDAINSRRDVVDVIGTYEELETYPTTDLTDKDIVKVIDDSSHNNTSSYFRWDATTSEWSYVGSEAATYTKAESDEKYALKTTTINGQSLASNVTLTYSDVNALSDTTKYAKSLEASGRTVTLKDQDGTVLSTITTQDTTYTAGDGIEIDENNKIINTKVSAVWGNIEGTLADQEDLVAELDKKADKETTYTKTEVDNLLSPKATTEYVDGEVDKLEQSITDNVNTINQALALKADKTEIPTKVSELENDSGYLTQHQDISGKADITYVDEKVAELVKVDEANTKAITDLETSVNNALALKADKTYVDEKDGEITVALNTHVNDINTRIDTEVETLNGKIDLKADKETTYTKTEVDNLLEEQATTINDRIDTEVETLNSAIDLKADKTYVDEELAKKADKTYVDTELAKKASITYVDGEIDKVEEVLATKATKSNSLEGYGITDAYTKEEVDALIEDFEALPDQNGNANKALVTNGTEASWQYTTLFKNIDEGTQVGSSQLVINKLSQEKYDELFVAGSINDDELYITVDDREFYTKEEVNQALDSKVDVDTHNSAVQQLQANIDLKADKSDTYTKAEVDAKVSSVYKFKGNVANYDALPTEGNVVGDVYNVQDTGDNYAWTEAGWDKLAGTIDLTPYLTKEEASTTYETISNVNTLKETVNTKANASDVYTKTEVDTIVENIDALPSQSGNEGKVLTTDGSTATWEKFYPGVIRVWE